MKNLKLESGLLMDIQITNNLTSLKLPFTTNTFYLFKNCNRSICVHLSLWFHGIPIHLNVIAIRIWVLITVTHPVTLFAFIDLHTNFRIYSNDFLTSHYLNLKSILKFHFKTSYFPFWGVRTGLLQSRAIKRSKWKKLYPKYTIISCIKSSRIL